MAVEDGFDCVVVDGTSNGEHFVGVGFEPPGAGAFDEGVVDVLVGGLDAATSLGDSVRFARAVGDSVAVGNEVSDELSDVLAD